MSDEKQEIYDRITMLVARQLKCEASSIKAESSFEEDLGADSLDRVELVMAMEEEFNLIIVDEDAEGITTVQQAIDYIVEHPHDED